MQVPSNMRRLRVGNVRGFWTLRYRKTLPGFRGTKGHMGGKKRRRYYEMKAKCDPPWQKIAASVLFKQFSVTGCLLQGAFLLSCLGKELDMKTLWLTWVMSTVENQEIKLESNLIEWSQITRKRLISDVFLKKFSPASPTHCQLKTGTCHLSLQGLSHYPPQPLTFNTPWKEFRMETRNEAPLWSGENWQNRTSDS